MGSDAYTSGSERDVCPECGSGMWAKWRMSRKNCRNCGHIERPEIEFDHRSGVIRVGDRELKIRLAGASNEREYAESFNYEHLEKGVEGWYHPDYEDLILELWVESSDPEDTDSD